MTAAALPYFQIGSLGGVQIYGLILLAAMLLGGAALVHVAKKYGGELGGDNVLLAVVLVVTSFIGAHVFDIAWYRWGELIERPALLVRLFDGVSLYGAVIATAIFTTIWARARKLDLGMKADHVAYGALVATVIGRIGCALVHDHPGVETELPIGVDFPADRVFFLRELPMHGGTIRLHDTGLEELVLLLPLLLVAWRLTHRQLRAGMLAAIIAIGYAMIRFPLDFLRHPATERTVGALTAAQWCSLAMLVLALGALYRITHTKR
jgi:phosphatidylglycerol:prolipoprotein diacylglycerol transferase